jgi:hypothetical protein
LKDFNSLSGPWVGFSIQDGVQIHERFLLVILNGRIRGTGTDKDGKFDVEGQYTAEDGIVAITRIYTWTTEPSQDYAGVPYEYVGNWDGSLTSGRYFARRNPEFNGEFEMWPDQDEESISEILGIEQQEPLALI